MGKSGEDLFLLDREGKDTPCHHGTANRLSLPPVAIQMAARHALVSLLLEGLDGDSTGISPPLLLRMACDDRFIDPLRAFKYRR